MAMGIKYVCINCKPAIMAWDDGNPYYIDEAGAKQYAYHPDHKNIARCIGNDSPHLCLARAEEFMVDSRAPIAKCPESGADEILQTFNLEGQQCPCCKAGVFAADPSSQCIS